ncbi:MAG: hypothetical protein PHW89_08615 [Sulfurimonas denitrificans]|nr:hypothetical protein [Sulfurimonas denitrificans]
MNEFDKITSVIKKSIAKFNLDLSQKTILTEAAMGNYVVTPIIAALAGAKKVYAFTKDSKYGLVEDVKKQTNDLLRYLNIEHNVEIITDLNNVNLDEIDILTNTGFLRPINSKIINQLNKKCVIPLMWETWEYRKEDLNLDACLANGIKVYGTNEDDFRLKTKEYLGFMILKFLLNLNHTPISSNILILGCEHFTIYVQKILMQNGYKFTIINKYDKIIDTSVYDAIVILEHDNNKLLIGDNGYIKTQKIKPNVDVIHICGSVDFTNASFNYVPKNPAPFGYMSYTVDNVGSNVIIDLHTAGLKVALGMIEANELKLKKSEYKNYMQNNYPAMSFQDEKYW